ncbi:MFS transporter [Sphingomonas immobilis]|uniref:Permease n=1 Tax=Sphingomonas immobilis TaxID=3063997 RepID=A0ABT9A6E5_9SPHN|nr:permease [Sphingomonas sp. CA1-15]MDO7844551.1 permease [Sphingomonas sp. CA1-15]
MAATIASSGAAADGARGGVLASPRARFALYLLLGFSAGLPYYIFSTVLSARLTKHGVDLVLIGFFGWVQLLPTFKFAWAPLLDRFAVPGFARFFGKRLGWIILSQIGIVLSMVAMAFTSADTDLPVVALFAVLLAFWTTTLEVSADAWRIELAPTAEMQGPLTAANLWGYRSAMVAAGSGALIVADRSGWTGAYLAIAAGAFVPLPILMSLRRSAEGSGERLVSLATGLLASAVVLAGSLVLVAVAGWLVLSAAAGIGISAKTDATTAVLVLCMLPFVIMALALPRIVNLPATARLRTSTMIGPYVDIFWRFGYRVLPLLGFVTFYRMGDVLTLAMSKPLEIAAHYDLTTMGVADGFVALPSSMAGVAIGALLAVRMKLIRALALGAIGSAIGNWIFVWLWFAPPSPHVIYISTALDQFAHGMEGAIFVVYLSLLVNPKYPGAQYAFLSGFAFLLPRLLAGAGGVMVKHIGFDGFFWLSGALSLAAVVFLPFIANAKPRSDD